MSCLACPAGYITLPQDKALFEAPGGAWARESQNAARLPSLPCLPHSSTSPCSSWKAQHRVQSWRKRLRPGDTILTRVAPRISRELKLTIITFTKQLLCTRHWDKSFTCIILCKSLSHHEISILIIPILQKERMECRQSLTQGHTARK